jgi:hypothetical protein
MDFSVHSGCGLKTLSVESLHASVDSGPLDSHECEVLAERMRWAADLLDDGDWECERGELVDFVRWVARRNPDPGVIRQVARELLDDLGADDE